MAKQQEQRFAIVFRKLDEILAPKKRSPAIQLPFDLSKQEADEIDELRCLAQEFAEEPPLQVATST
jgi:hypothetical protein